MAQHFRNTPAARNFGVADLAALTPLDADKMLQAARWGAENEQVCPHCGAADRHYQRPPRKPSAPGKQRRGSRRPASPAKPPSDSDPTTNNTYAAVKAKQTEWECRHCFSRFTVTSHSIFHGTKLSNWEIVSAITLALGGANGIAGLELSSHLGWNPSTSFLFLHRVREVMSQNLGEEQFEGLVQMDGGYFGGKPRKPNQKKHVSREQLAKRFGKEKIEDKKRPWVETGMTHQNWRKSKNKRVVIVVTQSGHGTGAGSSRVRVFVSRGETEKAVSAIAKKYIKPGTEIHTDESGAYTSLSTDYVHFSVRHSKEFSTSEGVSDNHAEAFFSRLRRAEYGIYHGMRIVYLYLYASESAWRHNNRKIPKLEQIQTLLRLCLRSSPSKTFTGYHQGKGLKTETLYDSLM